MIQDGLAQMQTFGMTNTTDYAEALFSLGVTYMKMGNYAKAAEQLGQVEKIQKLLGQLEEEISLSYFLKPSTITVGRDLLQAMQDLLANPKNWEEN